MGVSGMSDAGSALRLHYPSRQINELNEHQLKNSKKKKEQIPNNPSPKCVDELLAPIKSKMKVLKKIKRKMGLASRSSNSGTNNLPPILFHEVRGENIRICQNGAVARRVESFCKGITFSSRPIKVGEKVCLKFVEISVNWSGVIRFGFTSNDPSTLKDSLPKYACPDLTNKPGYWAKALAERYAEQDSVLYYYVTATGDVHFGINGEEKGFFFSGVETRGPLWALVDVYGNSTAVEIVDSRLQLNNSRRTPVPGPDSVDRLIMPMSHMALESACGEADTEAMSPRFQPAGAHFQWLAFHRVCGRNVRLNGDHTVATRVDTEYSQGYVFTARPVELGERIVVQVLDTNSSYMGALAFGLTSCNPAHLESCDLPEDADMLLDRNEYWVVNKDVASNPQRGEEITFCVTVNGEVQMSRNGGTPVVFMHVDQSLQLWAFFDVYGSTQKIRMLGSMVTPPRATPPQPTRGLHVSLPPTQASSSDSHHHHPSASYCQQVPPPPVPVTVAAPVPAPVQAPPPVPPPIATTVPAQVPAQLVQLQAAAGGGTMLVVNLPPAHSNYLNHQQQVPSRPSPDVYHYRHSQRSSSSDHPQPSSSGTLLSTYSHTYIEPVSSSSSYPTIDGPSQAWADAANMGTMGRGSECSICYERPVDSVLYMCGHMCMCYECAVQQWRGKGGGHCPLCRALIRDVIRTYKS